MIRRYSWPYWFFVLEKPVFSTRTQGSDSIPLSEYWLEMPGKRYLLPLHEVPEDNTERCRGKTRQIALIRDIGIGSPY
jgi:hypothetical protein